MIKKYSNYVASSWEEYSAQGPQFKSIEDWWKRNWNSVPGASGSEYRDWTDWYNSKYRAEWGNSHKSPEEALRIMKGDKSSPVDIKSAPLSRGDKIKERLNKTKNILQTTIPDGNEFPNKKNGVNFADFSDDVLGFLKSIMQASKILNVETPVVTSGFRDSTSQAIVMANNWSRHGGSKPLSAQEIEDIGRIAKEIQVGIGSRPITKGSVYLYKLYSLKKFGFFVNNTLHDQGINKGSISVISNWIESNVPKTSHRVKPATSVDLRLTEGIKDVLDYVKQSGQYSFRVLPEDDHFHIDVRGKS